MVGNKSSNHRFASNRLMQLYMPMLIKFRFILRDFLLILSLYVSCILTVSAHPFHTTLTEIEYNPDTSQLEIAIKFKITDLEESLGSRSDENQPLDNSEEAMHELLTYINNQLRLTASDKPVILEWQGKDAAINTVWVFLSAPVEGCKVSVNNRLLVDNYPQQLNNLVQIKSGSRKSYQLHRNQTHQLLDFCE